MSRLAILLLTAAAAFAADDPWSKVKDLKSGTEIRVLKKGSMQPVLGKFDEATDDNLTLVVKNAQIAIPKEQIDRLDYRPPQTGGRLVKETKTKTDEGDAPKPPRMGMDGMPTAGTSTTTSTNVSIQEKPDFETLYRRPAAAPKK
ncbi:MAG TPA: hypothetical protein VGS58_21095 [Candidatus Sulfopaludibacter sp.]|nr:hypothetical protein [Candidatus Sulfopaludibacter sp.]